MDFVSRIDDFKIIEHLGHGAMGSVEKVESIDGRVMALKTLSPHLAREGDYVKRFKREAEIAIQLSHPNVVRVYEVGEDQNGLPFIVMEYVEGKTLDEIMQSRGMMMMNETDITLVDDSEQTLQSSVVHERSSAEEVKNFTAEETIKLGRQLAGVLQSAHDLNLLHRDIKPQNIMIDKKGNAKLLDFGIAKALDGVYSALSLTGQAIGTPAYMSPEQFAGSSDIDIRSDLYSLGCTMYHMLTGRPPFRGASLTALANMHLNTYAQPACEINKTCPRNLSQVIDRLLAKKAEDRHKAPFELVEDLNRVERGEVPLKLHKIRKSREHNPLKTWLYVGLTIAVLSSGFAFFSAYKSKKSKTLLENEISDARQLAVKHQYDRAKEKLDQLIAENADSHPVIVENAKKLRLEILNQQASYITAESERERKIALERRQQAERKRLEEENAARIGEIYESIRMALHKAQNKNTIAESGKYLSKALKLCLNEQERQKVLHAEKQVNTARDHYRKEAEQQAEAEQLRKLEAARQAKKNAERINKLNDSIRLALQAAKSEKTLQDADKLVNDAYDLCTNNEERAKVSSAETKVNQARTAFEQEAARQAELKRKQEIAAAKLARENAERKGKINELLRQALRLARDKTTIKESNQYLDQAYKLCKTLDEKQKVVTTEKNIIETEKQYRQAELLQTATKKKITTLKITPRPGSEWIIPRLNMKLAYLQPGSFLMGSNDSAPDEKPRHKVELTKGFWIGIHEVTQNEYEVVTGKNPSKAVGANLPVEQVSWKQAVDFCKQLTEFERKAGRLPDGYVYRLPTEAEWEYAARGNGDESFSGSNQIEHVAWYYGNSHQKTRQVGTKRPNDFGLYDMTGNVWEWCLDACETNDNREVVTSTYKNAVKDPVGAKGKYRIYRGGSWGSLSTNCHVSNRRHKLPNESNALLGFRIVLAPPR